MTPQKLALTPFTEGDTWNGIPSLTVTVNGSPPASALSLVTMRFKKSGESGTVVELTSPGQITINSALNWTLTVPAQILAGLTSGKWDWRMRFTDAAGKKRTYLADQITVLESI